MNLDSLWRPRAGLVGLGMAVGAELNAALAELREERDELASAGVESPENLGEIQEGIE